VRSFARWKNLALAERPRGHQGNELCDRLAHAEIAKIKKAYSVDQLKDLLAQFAAKENAEQVSEELFEGSFFLEKIIP